MCGLKQDKLYTILTLFLCEFEVINETFGYEREEAVNLPLEAPLTCPSSSFTENHTPSKRFILLHNPIHRYFSNKRH